MTSTSLTLPSTPPEIDPEYAERVREHYGLACLPRWGTLRDFSRPTFGGKWAKVASALGTPWMPHQRYVADIAGEVDLDTGLLVYRGADITFPRQNGKTSLILPVMVHRGLAWQRQRILYGAQSGVAAREKWEDEHLPMLAAARALRGKYRLRKANGREAILWRATESIHWLTTNTEKSSHGKSLDLAALDEYFAQVDYRMDQACGPAMITKANAQKWRLSTAGTSRSLPFNAMRIRGRAAVAAARRSRIAFFDWCALPGQRRDDPAVWRQVMPALCPAPVRGVCRCSKQWRHTVTEDAIWAELEDLADQPEEFDRAYLNISRDDGEVDADPNVPAVAEWELLAEPEVARGDIVALGVDISPLRDRAAIVAAGWTLEGLPCLMLLEHGDGVEWLMAAIKRLHVLLNPVAWALDEKSPAGTLILPMERAGIIRQSDPPERGQLWIPTVPQLGAACADFTDLVRQGHLVHTGQEPMTAALEGAVTRRLGDGLFAWGRRLASADLTPLYGGTFALAALQRWHDLIHARTPAPAAARTDPAAAGSVFRPTSRLSI